MVSNERSNSIADMYIQCCQTPPEFSTKHVYIVYIFHSARFRCYVESRSGIINMSLHVSPRLTNTISTGRTRFFSP